ncbi:MAG TPA: CoA-binding protein, partial [Syntrophales bacterium]|nr:CoA-binding protein [Syntrophales bacterium]
MDKPAIDLGVFLQPRSVAVIGASDKPGSWGSFMMEGLAARRYPGTIYPVNRRAGTVFGHPAFTDVRDIPGEVDLAVMAVPEAFVEETIRACGEKGVRGMS